MDKIINPYRPGAGLQPITLAGRNKVIEKAEVLLKRVKHGAPQRSIMLYGLRGVGKTVLLNKFEEIALSEGYIVQLHEMSDDADLQGRSRHFQVSPLQLPSFLLRTQTISEAY